MGPYANIANEERDSFKRYRPGTEHQQSVVGVIRQGVGPSGVVKKYNFNGRWEVAAGQEFVTADFQIDFWRNEPRPIVLPNQSYRTIYTGFKHSAHVIQVDSVEQNLALTNRLLGEREPETPGLCAQLRRNQMSLLADPLVKGMYKEIADSLSFPLYKHRDWERLEHYADPHPKRLPRIFAQWQLSFGREANEQYTNYAIANLKPLEYAKPNKVGRTVIDMTCPASLLCAWLIGDFKKQTGNVVYRFKHEGTTLSIMFGSDASFETVSDAFQYLHECESDLNFLYFSDDMCVSYRNGRGVHFKNIDISGCDRSHTDDLFLQFRDLFPIELRHEAQAAIDQCKLPLLVYPPEYKKHNTKKNKAFPYVLLNPLTYNLYSGSTITTSMNNVACMLIAFSSMMLHAHITGDFRTSAENAGYLVTIVDCQNFEDLQFLKQSPVFVGGKVVSIPNLALYLRSVGVVNGSLKGEPHDVYRRLVAANLACMYSRVSSPVIEEAKRHFGQALEKDIQLLYEEHKHQGFGKVTIVPHECFTARYPIAYLPSLTWFTPEFGMSYHSAEVDTVFAKDYEYTPAFYSEEEVAATPV